MSKKREILRLLDMGLSHRLICKSVKVSPHTVGDVKKFCDSRGITYKEAMELSDEELESKKEKEVKFSSARRPDCQYIHSELKKRGVTLKLLHEEYVEECMILGEDSLKYTQFCNIYKDYVEDNKLTMHIERKPGEKIEVDWAGTTIPIYNVALNEKITDAYLFVGVLPFSQYMYAAASLDMKMESWINHHIDMFKYFDGSAMILQCDNLKTGVISHKKYEEVIYNKTYQEMCEYYHTAVIATRVKAPKDKASAEGSVGYLTNQIIGKIRNYKCSSIHELNNIIFNELNTLNAKPFQKREYSRTYVYENEEKEYLNPLPLKPYEYAIWTKAMVQFNYHVSYETNYYSVPYQLLRKTVDLRVSRYMIEIFYDGSRVASHARFLNTKGKYATIKEHMPTNHQEYGNWNKDRIINWSKKIGNNTYRVIDGIFTKAKFEVQVYHQCITILKLSDKYSDEILEKASEQIISNNITPIHRNFKTVIEKIQKDNTKTERNNDGAILRGASYFGDKND